MERKPMDVQRYLAIRRRQISRRFVNETEKRENMYQMVHGGEKQNNQYEFQPYWNPYKFVMKCLISALLIFLVNMTVNSSFPYKEQIVQQLETDFKFATAANWYEEHFSQLFSFVKPGNDEEQHGVLHHPSPAAQLFYFSARLYSAAHRQLLRSDFHPGRASVLRQLPAESVKKRNSRPLPGHSNKGVDSNGDSL